MSIIVVHILGIVIYFTYLWCMERIEKAHGEYYKYKDEYYTLFACKGKTLLFIDDDWREVIICNMKFKVLHEIMWMGESLGITV